MNSEKVLPVLRVSAADLTSSALVVGDPQRAAAAAEYLDDVIELGFYREYRTFKGTYSGVPITISSHGVGAAGAGICFEELFQGGVKTIIRAGTCGAMVKGIKDGETIIGTGAIRNDGSSDKLLPMDFPAIADRHIVAALEAASAARSDAPVHTGIVLTQAFFYDGFLPSSLLFWLENNLDVYAVEMEFATLLIIAAMRGARAGGIFTSDGNMTEEPDPLVYDPHRTEVDQGVENMIQIALDALAAVA